MGIRSRFLDSLVTTSKLALGFRSELGSSQYFVF